MRILLTAAALLLWAPPLFAQDAGTHAAPEPTDKPFLWMVESTPPSFLYGTIHLPDQRVLALPAVVREAFRASDALYTEIPMNEETMAKAVTAFQLPEGGSLKAILPEDLYARTDAYFQARGIPLAALDGMSPMLVAIQLMTLDYLHVMQTTPALDMMLYAQAGQAGKELGAIETIDEQIATFTSLSMEEQVELLDSTLEFMETADGTSVTEALILQYLEGSGPDLMELMHSYMEEGNPVHDRFHKVLFEERNGRMTDRIAATLTDNPDRMHFIAVGAGHFFGDTGILKGLKERGVKVTRLMAGDVEKVEAAAGAVLN